MTETLLIEIGLEDLPANVINQAETQLGQKVEAFLNDQRIKHGDITTYSTPRRLAVSVADVAQRQEDMEVVSRGPSQRIAQDESGEWTQAAIGFSKGLGATVEDIIFKEVKGESYTFIEQHVAGKPTSEILNGLSDVVAKLEFPKNMKWGTTSYQYIRPIHWLVALYGEEVIPFSVFDVETGRETYGHRFLAPAEIELQTSAEYADRLEEAYVVADRQARKQWITEQIGAIATEHNWLISDDYPGLLDEVTNLVEWPTAFYAEYDSDFLEVFDLVLEIAMVNHQRYFPVRDLKGKKLLPYFIGVRNGDDRNLDGVAQGNEKVLAARLADAKFFYEEDQKKSYGDWLDQLGRVDFHDQLGTILDKQERVNRIASVLADFYELNSEEQRDLLRATEIFKTDLVTEVVHEFPELQGTIGGQYALERGESKATARAISEQYLPNVTNGELPTSKLGALLSLADKLDTLIHFFAIDLIPTGSNDPFALRRQAMGIVRIMLDLDKNIDFTELLDAVISHLDLDTSLKEAVSAHREDLLTFIFNRLEQYLREHTKASHDVIQAAKSSLSGDFIQKVQSADALSEWMDEENAREEVQSIVRVMNLVKDESELPAVRQELFETASEKNLDKKVQEVKQEFTTLNSAQEQLRELINLSPLIDQFFDDNMVMVDDKDIRQNRLALLSEINYLAKRLADFKLLVI